MYSVPITITERVMEERKHGDADTSVNHAKSNIGEQMTGEKCNKETDKPLNDSLAQVGHGASVTMDEKLHMHIYNNCA